MNSQLLPLFISYRSSAEKLIKYQANSSCVIMFVILITTLFYKALILQGEIWCWSLLGLKGLSHTTVLQSVSSAFFQEHQRISTVIYRTSFHLNKRSKQSYHNYSTNNFLNIKLHVRSCIIYVPRTLRAICRITLLQFLSGAESRQTEILWHCRAQLWPYPAPCSSLPRHLSLFPPDSLHQHDLSLSKKKSKEFETVLSN